MRICQSMVEIPEVQWNSLLRASNQGELHPAMRHEYLLAMEQSGSATAKTGWGPVHLTLESASGDLLGAVPLYLKSHSYGEYVFDWQWAQAYQQHGLVYYPKLLCAIPFTPVTAPKLLAGNEKDRNLLATALAQFAETTSNDHDVLGVCPSSLHVLFTAPSDQAVLFESSGGHTLLDRLDKRHCIQFHWNNHNPLTGQPFEDFEAFLESLQQKKRKNIRAERRKIKEQDLTIRRLLGADITDEDLAFFYQCYANTYAEHYSSPYLTPTFFEQICLTMGEQVMLVIAERNGQAVAASFFLFGPECLYGRYWGCVSKIPCLHFELCYYQALEFAIERGIQRFEGGAQGEHKMARGLNPVDQISAHWVASPEFGPAIRRFLQREGAHLQQVIDELEMHQAFKTRND